MLSEQFCRLSRWPSSFQNPMKTQFASHLVSLLVFSSVLSARNLDPAKPNVIFIYYDDMGYSDMGVYRSNPSNASLTPNLDSFATAAMRFTAGHSADAVCTPSRYALLTGRYAWRTTLKTGVTGGYSQTILDENRFNFPGMFQSLGYETAMIGKWHVGMQFFDPQGGPVDLGNNNNVLDDDPNTITGDLIDFSRKVEDSPFHRGFDYFFGTSASLDMPPYLWIENDQPLVKGGLVVNGAVDFSQAVPATNATLEEGTPTLVGPSFKTLRNGVYDPSFVVNDYQQVQAAKVAQLFAERAADSEPFYLYVPVPGPHSPWSIQPAFDGITSFSYGDYMRQTDHYTGLILDALEDPDGDPNTDDSLASNTVVFISSDNGPERFAQQDSLANGYDGNGEFRGNKRDNWEGGTRVPFLIRWPGVVTPGESDFACWQGDFFASMADFLRYDLAPGEAPDAESFLRILQGQPIQSERRPGFIQHSISGQFAIVDSNGEFKLVDGTGSGGYNNTYDSNNIDLQDVGGVVGGTPRQLFNLLSDPGEDSNLLRRPTQVTSDKEAELLALLNNIRGDTTFGTDGDSNVPALDSDNDGMSNFYEGLYPTALDRDDPNDASGDAEPDGLTNLEEFELGTSPIDPDSDGDELGDFEEAQIFGTLPINPHSDGDALNDGEEVYRWGTDPLLLDTDGDGASDGYEVSVFTSPINPDCTPVPGSGDVLTFALPPSEVVLAGFNGNANDPAYTPEDFDLSNLSIRSRTSTRFQTRSQMFFRFDLNNIPAQLESARLRLHQFNRLNTVNSQDIELAEVEQAWAASPGNYPIFASTPVSNARIIGNNSDFGTAIEASGFFSGTVGTAGTDAGFDISDSVDDWISGASTNNGFRLAFANQGNVASAFTEFDDPATTDQNEAFELLLDVRPASFSDVDSDDDFLLDDYELAQFGNLAQSGDDDTDQDGLSNLVEQAIGSEVNGSDETCPFGFDYSEPGNVSFFYHRYRKGALGVETLFSEDLENWYPYTTYFSPATTSSASDRGSDYERVEFTSLGSPPEKLFVVFQVYTLRPSEPLFGQ